MIEIRKTDTFAKWIDSLRDIKAEPVFSYESSDYHSEIQGMLNQLAKRYQNYEFTMAAAIGSITRKSGKK
jgi:hypothetical protein